MKCLSPWGVSLALWSLWCVNTVAMKGWVSLSFNTPPWKTAVCIPEIYMCNNTYVQEVFDSTFNDVSFWQFGKNICLLHQHLASKQCRTSTWEEHQTSAIVSLYVLKCTLWAWVCFEVWVSPNQSCLSVFIVLLNSHRFVGQKRCLPRRLPIFCPINSSVWLHMNKGTDL